MRNYRASFQEQIPCRFSNTLGQLSTVRVVETQLSIRHRTERGTPVSKQRIKEAGQMSSIKPYNKPTRVYTVEHRKHFLV